MLQPTDSPPASCAPRFAASMAPGPPPVMTANPALASACPTRRAVSYASLSTGVLADPNTATPRSTPASASNPSTNSDRMRSTRHVSVSRNAARSRPAPSSFSSCVRRRPPSFASASGRIDARPRRSVRGDGTPTPWDPRVGGPPAWPASATWRSVGAVSGSRSSPRAGLSGVMGGGCHSSVSRAPGEPRLPGCFGLAGRDLVAVPDEREVQQAGVREQPLRHALGVGRQVREALLPVRPALRVDQRRGPEPIDEAPELARGERLLPKVDVVHHDPSLPEEPERTARRVGVVGAEHLDVRHLLRRRLAQRRGHQATRASSSGRRLLIERSVAPPVRRSRGPRVPWAARRFRVTIWFTVQLDDRPGSLARVAQALADRGVNITGIVGVAEDTDGALMLTTSDAGATREAFTELAIAFEEHDPTSAREPTGLSIADIVAGRPA